MSLRDQRSGGIRIVLENGRDVVGHVAGLQTRMRSDPGFAGPPIDAQGIFDPGKDPGVPHGRIVFANVGTDRVRNVVHVVRMLVEGQELANVVAPGTEKVAGEHLNPNGHELQTTDVALRIGIVLLFFCLLLCSLQGVQTVWTDGCLRQVTSPYMIGNLGMKRSFGMYIRH